MNFTHAPGAGRLWLVMLVLVATLATLAYRLFIANELRALQQAEGEAITLSTTLGATERELRLLQSAPVHVEDLRRALPGTLAVQEGNQTSAAQVLQRIRKLTGRHGLVLESYDVGDEKQQGALALLPATIVLRGDYVALRAFTDALVAWPAAMTLGDFSITATEDSLRLTGLVLSAVTVMDVSRDAPGNDAPNDALDSDAQGDSPAVPLPPPWQRQASTGNAGDSDNVREASWRDPFALASASPHVVPELTGRRLGLIQYRGRSHVLLRSTDGRIFQTEVDASEMSATTVPASVAEDALVTDAEAVAEVTAEADEEAEGEAEPATPTPTPTVTVEANP